MISDNGPHFQDKVPELLEKYKIEQHHSAPYRPQTNGAVEEANKNIKVIIKKTTDTFKDWHEKLHFALWGYRTTIRTSTGATPFSLTYGTEAVLPIELEVSSLRIALESQLSEAEWARTRYEQLAFIDEKRLAALYHTQGYQNRMARTFNKKVRPRDLAEGDLVLKQFKASLHDPRGKWKPNWSGPYLIKKIMTGGGVRITDLDGNELSKPVNLDQLKKYYV